ncbi:MAG: TraR/DksA C4-type zinc finger protein [Fulvivirga sp.]
MSLDKKVLKEKIREELLKTEEDIRELKAQSTPISPENAIGRVSRMDAINNKSISEASLRQAEDKHKKLLTALEKIDESTYGTCQRCQQTIPIGRLMLMPNSTKCVNCA